MSKRICKRILIALLFTLFLFLGSCACFEDKSSVEYEFEPDTYDLVKQAIADAKAERDTVKALAQAADQSKVFNNAGTTGWEAFIDEVDDSIDNFEYHFDVGTVYGAYSEDMEVSGSTGACLYHRDMCNVYYVVNLDYPSNIDPVCITHEGTHGEPDYPDHSNALYDLIDTLGGNSAFESSFWNLVVSDQDAPYDSSFFYIIAHQAYGYYFRDCGEHIDWSVRHIESAESTAEEEEASLRAYLADTLCEDVLLENIEPNIYPNYEEGFDVFGVTEEEFEDALTDELCPEVIAICEEMIDEADFASINPTNIAPTAVISILGEDLEVEMPILLSGLASTDSDGSIVSYEWDLPYSWDDVATKSYNAEPVVLYFSPGTYSVTLTVEDDDGATDTETVTMEVTAPSEDIERPTIKGTEIKRTGVTFRP